MIQKKAVPLHQLIKQRLEFLQLEKNFSLTDEKYFPNWEKIIRQQIVFQTEANVEDYCSG